MDRESYFMELEETYNHLSCLLNALSIMVLGLMQAKDPYVDGFHVLSFYLTKADQDMRNCLAACPKAE